jgi:hypothetical protein
MRKNFIPRLGQLQLDLDNWVREYNEEREHSGKYCFGETPLQTFLDAAHWRRRRCWTVRQSGMHLTPLACVLRRNAILKGGVQA